MSGKKSRANELTAVLNRSLFDELPSGITAPKDVARWRRYRQRYHVAQSLGEFCFPLQLDFELNSHCNLRCSFCTHGHEVIKKKTLPFHDFAKVIDEGERYGLCSIKLNYINEPLLVPDICKYIDYARARGVLNVYFATNGTLLDDAKIDELIDAKVSKVMVSLDATTAETFALMRHSNQFDQIVGNVRRLLNRRAERGVSWPLVRVNFLKTELNIHEADDFVSLWSGVADMIGFQDRVNLPGIDNDLTAPSPLPVLENDKRDFRCSFPYKLMVVDSNGDILPCCTFSGRALPMGNVADMTIREAWDGLKMRKLKRLHRDGGYAANPVCKHCVESSGATL